MTVSALDEEAATEALLDRDYHPFRRVVVGLGGPIGALVEAWGDARRMITATRADDARIDASPGVVEESDLDVARVANGHGTSFLPREGEGQRPRC
jgi:hypothetical protein